MIVVMLVILIAVGSVTGVIAVSVVIINIVTIGDEFGSTSTKCNVFVCNSAQIGIASRLEFRFDNV